MLLQVSGEDTPLVSRLYEIARRRALKVGDAVANLLNEIEKPKSEVAVRAISNRFNTCLSSAPPRQKGDARSVAPTALGESFFDARTRP